MSIVNTAPVFAAITKSNQVSVFSYPNLNGSDASPGNGTENANLASIVQSVINRGGDYRLDTSIKSFADTSLRAKLDASGFFFMTDMERGSPTDTAFLPVAAQTTIRDWVSAGGVIMMTATGGSADTVFLNTIFGWDLTTTSGSTWALNTANAAGTPFAGGPATLSNLSATDAIGKGTVANFKAIYGTDSNATVAAISYGKGTVIFLGFDYFDAGIAGTGFQASAPQYLADVTTGSASTDVWVTQMIPRAMEYSAALASNYILNQTGAGLERTNTLVLSDADSDVVTVAVSAVAVVQKDSAGAVIAANDQLPNNATLLAMMGVSPDPVLDGAHVTGNLTWTFNSGSEAFKYLRAGEKLLLSYTLTATDANGNVGTTVLELTINGSNDVPVIAGVPTLAQDVVVGSATALADFTVQDADSSTLTVLLTPTNGSVAGLDGWTQTGANWSKTGTAAELNTALAAATFKATAKGSASLQIQVTDDNNTTATTLYNLTAKDAPVVVVAPMIDGVSVTTSSLVLPGGVTGQTLSIPLVTTSRTEEAGRADAADIPLVQSNGSTILQVQVPVGYGLSATGTASVGVTPGGITLKSAIDAVTSNVADNTQLNANGQAALNAMASTSNVVIQTITPVAASSAPAKPLVIEGTASAAQHTALVIDASKLPAGSALTLNGVDFAAIVGAVSVTGNTAGQILSGDAASQNFTVTAAGSQVFAGGGSDTLSFAASSTGTTAKTTQLHGGKGVDTGAFSDAKSAYNIEQHAGYTLVTRIDDPANQVKLVNVETLSFADSSVAVASSTTQLAVASLYQNILGRQADVAGFEFWNTVTGTSANSLGATALAMAQSVENASNGFAMNGNSAHDVAVLYKALLGRDSDAAGLAFWTQQKDNGASLASLAQAFVVSTELVGQYKAATDWDFAG